MQTTWQKGALGVVEAAAWLLRQDYMVFHNVSHWGLVDLVGIKDGEIFLFDVKDGIKHLNPASVTIAQWELGVKARAMMGRHR